MACCNNECLEIIYADCVEYTGPLTNLPPNLGDMIPILDDLVTSGANETITMDLKCLSSNCGDTIPYSYTYSKPIIGATNVAIGITLGTPVTGLVTVKAVHNGNIIATINSLDEYLAVPFAYSNLGFTVIVEIVTTAPYYGTFYISPAMVTSTVTGLELVCQGNGEVQISKLDFYKLVVNKLCELMAG